MSLSLRHCFSIAILSLFSFAVSGQAHPKEYWHGNQCFGQKCQAVVLRVDVSTSPAKATVDLPDFGALNIPASSLAMDSGKIHFELVGDESTLVFDGAITEQSIRGNWRDGIRKGEFLLARADDSRTGFTEEDVSFQNGQVRLAGTLLLPKAAAPVPGVIFVQGAGPETRSASRFLAEYLVARGIAALIYDKRGAGVSSGDWQHSSFEDLAGDTTAAIEYLKKRREIAPDRVGLFGSSQGGWIAPMAATRASQVCFVVVKSAAGVTPEEEELGQVATNLRRQGHTAKEVQAAVTLYRQMIAYARTRQNWTGLSAAITTTREKYHVSFGDDITRDWWFFDLIQKTFSHDPVPVLRKVQSPVLIIFGGKDTYLPLNRSLARLVPALSGAKSAVIQVFPNAGHDLRVETEKGQPYDFPRFAPGYLETLASWVQLQAGSCGR